MRDCSCRKNTIGDYQCEVALSERLSERILWLTMKCSELAENARPGNGVMVFPSNCAEPFLGRPFGVADADKKNGTVSVCYMLYGRGTGLMSEFKSGSTVRVRGFFGTPLHEPDGKVYLTGGGVGIAIFLLYNKMFPGRVAGLYLGIPGNGCERYAEKILLILPNAKIFTDDGSFGEGDSMFKVLPKELGAGDEVWSCGPSGFLRAMRKHYANGLDKLYLSLDKRMACGYGGCMGCVIETKDGPKRICVDQSLFRADEVSENDC